MSARSHRALLAMLGLLACSGCGQDESPPVEEVDAAVAEPPTPTPEQERALANQLHRAHLGATPPAACGDCHRISGRSKDPRKTHRCLSCHEGNRSAIHAKVGDAQAAECLTCHDFLGKRQDPWTCASCHVGGEDVRQVEITALAPKVEVHSSQWCGNCHVPHGDSAMAPRGCYTCHAQKATRHRKQELPQPEQCQECHVGHDPAARASTRCAACHAKVAPSDTATFRGHDACVTCHAPHGPGAPVKECKGCHGRTATLGAPRVAEHSRCQSCHDPHRVKAPPVDSCQRCHQNVEAKHPPDQQRGACAGCHPVHAPRARPVGAVAACSSCHKKAGSDTAFHARGVDCRQCHRPHSFSLKGAGAAQCATCHGPGATGKPRAVVVKPAAGHAECTKCHREAAHTPTRPTPSCATCHRPEEQSLTRGHERCAECHAPHDGAVRKQCTACHGGKRTGVHAGPRLTSRATCQTCHRAHGPRGPAAPAKCESCHKSPLPGMHEHGKHQDCASCHRFHDQALPGGRAKCLEPCHTDQVNHEPAAQRCVACHPFGA